MIESTPTIIRAIEYHTWDTSWMKALMGRAKYKMLQYFSLKLNNTMMHILSDVRIALQLNITKFNL